MEFESLSKVVQGSIIVAFILVCFMFFSLLKMILAKGFERISEISDRIATLTTAVENLASFIGMIVPKQGGKK